MSEAIDRDKWALHYKSAWKYKINRNIKGKPLMASPITILVTGGKSYNRGGRMEKTTIVKMSKGEKSHMEVIKDGENPASLQLDAGRTNCKEQDKFHLDVIVFGLWLRKHAKNKAGEKLFYKRGEREGEPIYDWTLVQNNRDRKKIMKDLDEYIEDGDVALWRKMYIQCGTGHFKSWANISRECKQVCSCGGELTNIEYLCADCGEVVEDYDNTALSDDEYSSLEMLPLECQHCGYDDVPVAVKECSDCTNPVPMSIQNLVIEVKQLGTGTSSSITMTKFTPIGEFTDAAGNLIVELDDEGNPIVVDGEPLFVEGLDEIVKAEWDFTQMYTIDPGVQSKFLGLKKGDKGFSETAGDIQKKRESRMRF